MRIVFSVIIALLAFVSAVPKVKVFEINDDLKSVISKEKLEKIKQIFIQSNTGNARESNTDEPDCIQDHLDNISNINEESNKYIYSCKKEYQYYLDDLEKEAFRDKANIDGGFNSISKDFAICEQIKDAEEGLKCQINLKSSANNVTKLSYTSRRVLDALHKNKEQVKASMVFCIETVVDDANRRIEIEYAELLECK
ncbi:hypothetical protein ACFFRR_006201 [Megaselia abdita]